MTTVRKQRGATLVEGALTMLVFFSFLFAVLEFGRAYNMYQVLTNAAREGARFAVAPCSALPATPPCPYGVKNLPNKTDITSYVQNYLATASIPTGSDTHIDICQGPADSSCSSATTPDPCYTINSVTTCYTVVDVSAPYQFLFFKYATVNIHSEASMRNENN